MWHTFVARLLCRRRNFPFSSGYYICHCVYSADCSVQSSCPFALIEGDGPTVCMAPFCNCRPHCTCGHHKRVADCVLCPRLSTHGHRRMFVAVCSVHCDKRFGSLLLVSGLFCFFCASRRFVAKRLVPALLSGLVT